jgi:lycopene cyclase domain-containing protein
MTYVQFLLTFIVPPMLVFGWLMRRRINRRLILVIGGLILMAVAYTTPWDNYLVATGVWYYDPRLVLNITFGYVPAEEYTFFVLQTLMTSCFALWLWRRLYRRDWE